MPQVDIDGANSKVSADTIRGQSGTTVTIQSGHNLVGSGSGLTALPAANLTGTLPAISGASLTNLPAGGAWTVLATATASSAATVDFNGYFTSAYDNYVLAMNTINGVDGGQLTCRVMVAGSIETGASDYAWAIGADRDIGSAAVTAHAGESYIEFAQNTGTATGENYNGMLYINDPLDTTHYKSIWSDGADYTATPNTRRYSTAGTWLSATTALTGISISTNTGASALNGDFILWGIKNA